MGCEKCRLHGKIQIYGLGTALRLLFSDDDTQLTRNDLISLVNTLIKFSRASVLMDEFRWMEVQGKLILGGLGVAILITFSAIYMRYKLALITI